MRAMSGSSRRSLAIRLAVALPLSGTLMFLGWQTGDPRLAVPMVLPAILAFALIVTPGLTAVFGDWAGRLLGSDKGAEKKPVLSKAHALRLAERYEEALAAYRTILVDHPHEARIWGEALEVAAVQIGDLDRAKRLHYDASVMIEDDAVMQKVNAHYLRQIERHPESPGRLEIERLRIEGHPGVDQPDPRSL